MSLKRSVCSVKSIRLSIRFSENPAQCRPQPLYLGAEDTKLAGVAFRLADKARLERLDLGAQFVHFCIAHVSAAMPGFFDHSFRVL